MSGKYTRSGKRSFGSRSVFLMLALVLVIGCTIGGTLAWLTAKTSDVQNTFVAGQIGSLALEESDTDTDEGVQHNYVVIPGDDITKDPKVTYTPTTAEGTVPVDAYVFVKLSGIGQNKWTWNESAKQYEIKSGSNVVMSFAIADGWTAVPGVSDVYYKEVGSEETLNAVSIIDDDNITVSHLITEQDVETVAAAANGLTFTAYAIQQHGFNDAAAAWAEVSGTT